MPCQYFITYIYSKEFKLKKVSENILIWRIFGNNMKYKKTLQSQIMPHASTPTHVKRQPARTTTWLLCVATDFCIDMHLFYNNHYQCECVCVFVWLIRITLPFYTTENLITRQYFTRNITPRQKLLDSKAKDRQVSVVGYYMACYNVFLSCLFLYQYMYEVYC